MSSQGKSARRTDVDRRRFLTLLSTRLQYRWHGDPQIISDAIADLFDDDDPRQEQLVSDLVIHHRTKGPLSRYELWRWLHKHPVPRTLFKKRKTIPLPANVADVDQRKWKWPVPEISNQSELAQRLSFSSAATIDWLTLPHRRGSTIVDHYRRQSHRKRDGTNRWIEQPRPALKRVQRVLKSEWIDHIPLHDAAHGFRRGRSIATCARPHVGRSVVLRMDLQNYFASIRTWRVRSLLLFAGCTAPVATTIAQLCTAPPIRDCDHDLVLRHSRLPQGAPTSPGLANAISFRLDRRLSGLSKSLGVTYTRYADDLIFSGDDSFARRTERFATSAAAIAMDEGFTVHFRKTRTMRKGNRQQVLGLIVNQQLRTPRRDYEILKAILTNCIRRGPLSQNRDAHPNFRESLRGRIAHVASTHPGREQRLLQLFSQIDWNVDLPSPPR